MIRKIICTLFILIGCVLFASCSRAPVSSTLPANMSNPASVYCEQNGGKLEFRQDELGGVTGFCIFLDGSECDEWEYFRGECNHGDALIMPSPVPTVPAGGVNGHIVFCSNRDGGYNHIYLVDINDLSLKRLTQDQTNAFSGPFSPDGTKLLFTGFGLIHSYVGMMNSDGSGQIDVTNQTDSDEAFPAWSPDGKFIAFTSRRDGNNEVYVMDANGSDPRRLTNNPKDDFSPAWSPDGTRIAFVSDRDNQTGIYSLYVMNADGTAVTRLTQDKSNDYSPDWSPDGELIVYHSIRDGQADIYVINTDGTGERDLTNTSTDDYAPRWSLDGSQIAFQTNRDGNWEIYIMNTDGSHPLNLSNDPGDDQLPYWKP